MNPPQQKDKCSRCFFGSDFVIIPFEGRVWVRVVVCACKSVKEKRARVCVCARLNMEIKFFKALWVERRVGRRETEGSDFFCMRPGVGAGPCAQGVL